MTGCRRSVSPFTLSPTTFKGSVLTLDTFLAGGRCDGLVGRRFDTYVQDPMPDRRAIHTSGRAIGKMPRDPAACVNSED